MARRIRLEVEGGLYHLMVRGNDGQDIFHSEEDDERFLAMLGAVKEKLPFMLYAYCLMTNHLHLLIERRSDAVGRIMHRLLTGYSQYYNRKYRHVGHVLQGRYKAILCQSDPYLAELVRYIHLNPVKAKMVERPEDYLYSSHRSYMGIEPSGIVDVDPLLRRFSPKKAVARRQFAKHVAEGMKMGELAELFETPSGVLGSEGFVDSIIHRMGEFVPKGSRHLIEQTASIDPDALIAAVEAVCGVPRSELRGRGKSARLVQAKEALIVCGRKLGVSNVKLAQLIGVNSSTVSRRYDSAIMRSNTENELKDLVTRVNQQYNTTRIAISQA